MLSVGLDVGTTTTQLILSRLTVENRAGSFAVPEMEICQREVLYRSPVVFTPLLGEDRVDGDALRTWVEQEYSNAGIEKSAVDTGAIIITGETSRKENAAAVLKALAGFAGDFVAAAAGPDLESVLAAKGAGAAAYSAKTGKRVLHMDIGGGTANLALIENGKTVATGCLNVGGRLLKMDKSGKITYVSPVLQGLTDLRPGDYPAPTQVEGIARILTTALEMAAGLRPATTLLDKLRTKETAAVWQPPTPGVVLSFSGGVADCIRQSCEPGRFGDMGPELGAAIGNSLLCQGEFMLGEETIRATVIGAGCYSAQLSGSTVYFRNVQLPLKNLPVAVFTKQEQDAPELAQIVAHRLSREDAPTVVLAMPGYKDGGYEAIGQLAEKIAEGTAGRGVYVCLEADMAKALGQRLCLLLPPETPCLCIDRVRLAQGSFLDVGSPVGPALPVVVKTLVLENGGTV